MVDGLSATARLWIGASDGLECQAQPTFTYKWITGEPWGPFDAWEKDPARKQPNGLCPGQTPGCPSCSEHCGLIQTSEINQAKVWYDDDCCNLNQPLCEWEVPGFCAGSDCCPSDPTKILPGLCGCGFADEGLGGCTRIKSTLVHRYRFDGLGTQATDSVGTAHGTVASTQMWGDGRVTLSGGTSGQHVDLPDGIVSALSDATLEAWVTLSAPGSTWQRIFDFGSNNGGQGLTYLYLSPRAVPNDVVTVTYSASGQTGEVRVAGTSAMATGLQSHVAVVVDGTTLLLYLDGERKASGGPIGPLSAISDVNSWLGRSQFTVDPGLAGSIVEFRIYNAALTAEEIQTSFRAGPDAAFLDKR